VEIDLIKKIGLISLCSLLLLTSCKNSSLTYAYLMQHPSILQKEMMHCQLTLVENAECEVVKRAARDFSQLIVDRQANPEQFGERILRAEEQSSLEQVSILLAVVAETGGLE